MTFFYGAAYWEHFTTRTGVYITCFMLVPSSATTTIGSGRSRR